MEGENQGHRCVMLIGEHELLPCFPLWLISELSKFINYAFEEPQNLTSVSLFTQIPYAKFNHRITKL